MTTAAASKTTASFDEIAQQITQVLLRWTPRILIPVFVGYYSLGIAYDWGLMAAIDQIAISILRNSVGYAGIGAAMPTFQWYSAWGVRTVAAVSAGLIYDASERLTLFIYDRCQTRFYRHSSPPPGHTPLVTLKA